MRKKSKAFRPILGDVLEDRAVPTGGLNTFLGAQLGVPSAVDAQAVSKAIQGFEKTYNADVKSVLASSGSTAFTSAINTALGTLGSSFGTTLANLPSGSTLAGTVSTDLTGSASTSLQSRLDNLTIPITLNAWSERMLMFRADWIIDTFARQEANKVAAATNPTGTVTLDQVQAVLSKAATDIQTFVQSYIKDVTTVLMPSGTTNPSTNKAAFNAAVATDLGTLSTSLTADTSTLPASLAASLQTTIQKDLLSNTTNTGNLQDALAKVSLPTNTRFPSTFRFWVNSSRALGQGVGQLVTDMFADVKTYNGGLPAS